MKMDIKLEPTNQPYCKPVKCDYCAAVDKISTDIANCSNKAYCFIVTVIVDPSSEN